MSKIEARKAINNYYLLKLPYIGRLSTERFVTSLYKKGADSVEISDIQHQYFVLEMYIRSNHQYTKKILLEIIKTDPYAILEIKRNEFRVNWKLGWT